MRFQRFAALVCASSLALSLAACSGKVAEVRPGAYQAFTPGADETGEPDPLADTLLFIDDPPDNALVTVDGAELAKLELIELPRDRWEEGCPTNFGATTMEVMEVKPRPLTIGGLTFEAPVLQAQCGAEGGGSRVTLREANGSCSDGCIQFAAAAAE